MESIISAIQMNSSDLIDANLIQAGQFIHQASTHQAQLVVLPEMFAIMGKSHFDKVLQKETFGSGKIQDFLSNQARKNGIWIVGGTIPIACDDPNKIRAACLVFNDLGDCVARYDKIHLFDAHLSENETYQESASTQAGDTVCVIDTPFGKLGLAVCFDLRFPELFRELYLKGAEILAVPSAFTVPTGKAHFEILVRSRAIDHFSYVITACQGGLHSSGRRTYGHAMMVSPWGEILSQKTDDIPGVIAKKINPSKVHDARNTIPLKEKNFIRPPG